jgi:hypothetical protein
MSSLITYGVLSSIIGIFGIVITTSQKTWFHKEWLKLTKKDLEENTLNIIKYVSFALTALGVLMLLGGIYLKTKTPEPNSQALTNLSVKTGKKMVGTSKKKPKSHHKKSKGNKKQYYNVKRKIYKGPKGSKYYTTRNSATHKLEKHYI